MVFGFPKKKKKSESKKNKKENKNQSTGFITTQTTEKILQKEQVAELLILEDLVDKKVCDHTVYTKVCAYYMVKKGVLGLIIETDRTVQFER